MQSSSFRLTMRSQNRKTGPIPVSTSSMDTCPSTCPMKGGGCYAEGGHLRIFWGNLSGSWEKFIEDVKSIPSGRLWRHNQAGDLPHDNGVIDRAALDQLVAANRGKRGFTFTHHDMSIPENREAVKEASAKGFTINLSANGIGEIDSLVALGVGPIATVLPMDAPEKQETEAGNAVIICPAVTGKVSGCSECGICAKPRRKAVVGFPAHGSRKKKVHALANKKC